MGIKNGVERPKDHERFTYKQIHMGVTARVVVYAPNQQDAEEAVALAFSRIAQLDDTLSDYRVQSAVNRISRQSGGPPVRVGPDLFRVLADAQRLSRESDGRFDVTVGPLTRLWREARRTGREPTSEERAAAQQRVGWAYMHLDALHQTVQLKRAGMQLDLGGIAKGYAAGEAYRVLAGEGLPRAMVEIGGDLYFGEAPPGERGWSLQLPGKAQPRWIVNRFVSTSGDEMQYRETEAGRFAHIIDLPAGRGHTAYASITVIAKLNTDGLATVMGVLGKVKGIQFRDLYYPDAEVYFWE